MTCIRLIHHGFFTVHLVDFEKIIAIEREAPLFAFSSGLAATAVWLISRARELRPPFGQISLLAPEIRFSPFSVALSLKPLHRCSGLVRIGFQFGAFSKPCRVSPKQPPPQAGLSGFWRVSDVSHQITAFALKRLVLSVAEVLGRHREVAISFLVTSLIPQLLVVSHAHVAVRQIS